MQYTIYGIKNCGSVKKAFDYFKQNDIPYTFFDYKTQQPLAQQLSNWCEQKDWTIILNKKGTTWRNLDESVKNSVVDAKSAVAVMTNHTSTIKRPIIENEKGDIVAVGFDEAIYDTVFK